MSSDKKIRVVYIMTSCRKDGPVQQSLNIIKNLDPEIFEPILVTIYEERKNNSRLDDFMPYVKHYFVPVSKINILLGITSRMSIFLDKIEPDVVHTLGVFPDYLVSSIKKYKQILTLRNYAAYDYPDKYGKFKGKLLAKMQVSAAKKATIAVTCSKSLQKIYRDKMGLETKCIQNGVDVEKYSPVDQNEKMRIREKIGLSQDDEVFIYSGQFIGRKNIPFMIDGFNLANTDSKFLLLGDGTDYSSIKEKYGRNGKLIFTGAVDNVSEYLAASDIYISASKSEGLPNGVLEAMAMGLAVLLSDIPQHRELVLNGVKNGGMTFKLGSMDDYIKKINKIREFNVDKMGKNARKNIIDNFTDEIMAKKYQDLYKELGQSDEK